MELVILNEEQNKLFERNEVRFQVNHENEKTPSLTEVRHAIAKRLSTTTSMVIIVNLKPMFGLGLSVGEAHVYKKESLIKDYEPAHIIKRNQIIEKKDESKAEEAKEELKVEVKKEEKPKESEA